MLIERNRRPVSSSGEVPVTFLPTYKARDSEFAFIRKPLGPRSCIVSGFTLAIFESFSKTCLIIQSVQMNVNVYIYIFTYIQL